MGVAVFPLNITGFNGTRNIKRNPSHMEVSKEKEREREEGRREGKGLFVVLFLFNFLKARSTLEENGLGLCASGWNIFAVK